MNAQHRRAASPGVQIYFMRHGETAWSLSGQHTGRSDLPLTRHGEVMARRLGRTLRGIAFSQVLTSPRLRAMTTCQLAGLGNSATHSTTTDPDLAEWDYGEYEGLRTEDPSTTTWLGRLGAWVSGWGKPGAGQRAGRPADRAAV